MHTAPELPGLHTCMLTHASIIHMHTARHSTYICMPCYSTSLYCSAMYSSSVSSNLLSEHRRLYIHLVKPVAKISSTRYPSTVCHLVFNFVTRYPWPSGSQLLPKSSPDPHHWPKLSSKNYDSVIFSHGIPTALDLCSSLNIVPALTIDQGWPQVTCTQSDKITVSGHRYHNLTHISHTHSHQHPHILSN